MCFLLVVSLVVFLNHMFLCRQLVWKQRSFKRVRPCRKDTHDQCDRCWEKNYKIKNPHIQGQVCEEVEEILSEVTHFLLK